MAARDEKNRKRSQSGSYYTYGNVAYELQPDYTPYRVREEEEERRREAARIAKEAERENKVSFAKMVGAVLHLWGCTLWWIRRRFLSEGKKANWRI